MNDKFYKWGEQYCFSRGNSVFFFTMWDIESSPWALDRWKNNDHFIEMPFNKLPAYAQLRYKKKFSNPTDSPIVRAFSFDYSGYEVK